MLGKIACQYAERRFSRRISRKWQSIERNSGDSGEKRDESAMKVDTVLSNKRNNDRPRDVRKLDLIRAAMNVMSVFHRCCEF